jgi:MFS superfamily sulfate permease-like transporter
VSVSFLVLVMFGVFLAVLAAVTVGIVFFVRHVSRRDDD